MHAATTSAIFDTIKIAQVVKSHHKTSKCIAFKDAHNFSASQTHCITQSHVILYVADYLAMEVISDEG
jgi:hydroxyacyl-ACP dehydratase HTD2-like protein with hotdog domain